MVYLYIAVIKKKGLSLDVLKMLWDTLKLKWSDVAQSCPTLCNPMDCSRSGSSIHRIFQARVLEWIAISFSRGSSRPRNQTQVSHIAGRRFTVWCWQKNRYKNQQILSTDFWQGYKIKFNEGRVVFSTNGTETTGYQ